MQLRKVKVIRAGYEINDIVSYRTDGIGWSPSELNSNTEIESGLLLSDGDLSKLIMVDERPTNFSAISKLPAFRSLATKTLNMKQLHRRKYHIVGGIIVRKSNAQVQ